MATTKIYRSELMNNPKFAKEKRAYLEQKYDFDGGFTLNKTFNFSDDEYDNFLTKEYWKRRKVRRTIRKDLKSEGLSNKDARKQARAEAREEVPRIKLKEAIKRGFNVFKKVTLILPRLSALSLIALNYRGIAEKLSFGYKDSTFAQKIDDKWTSLGGNPDKLRGASERGKDKKPFFCGAKCKAKIVGITSSEVSSVKKNLEDGSSFSNLGGVDDAVIAVWVGIGASVVGAMTGVVATIKNSKATQQALAEEKRVNSEMLALQTEAQTFEQDQTMTSPEAEIYANPDLTPVEKANAVKSIREALDPEGDGFGGKINKPISPLIIGALVVGGLFAMGVLSKLKKT
jgi:hypothetical protein